MKIKKVSNTSILTGSVIDNLNGNSTINAPSVRAVNEGLLDNYTINEQVIGTWLNKPLYRKVIHFTTGSVINTWVAVSGLSNIDNLVRYFGYAINNNESWPMPNFKNMPYFSVGIDSHNIREAHTETNYNSVSCIVAFEYTKVTD